MSTDDLIQRAADVEDKTVDEFIRDAAVRHAHDVLADRRLFVLDDAAWVEFLSRLRAPARPTPVLQELFGRDEGPWA